MSEQAAQPIAGPQRVGGAAGEAPTASPAEGGEGPLGIDELAERSEAFR
jgi:hypothetical protein